MARSLTLLNEIARTRRRTVVTTAAYAKVVEGFFGSQYAGRPKNTTYERNRSDRTMRVAATKSLRY